LTLFCVGNYADRRARYGVQDYKGIDQECRDWMCQMRDCQRSSTNMLEKLLAEVPEPTPTPTSTPKPTPIATPSPTPEPTPTPEVELDSDSDGVPDKYDYAPNDPTVQTKEDTKTPGFGVTFAICSLIAVAYLVRRRSR